MHLERPNDYALRGQMRSKQAHSMALFQLQCCIAIAIEPAWHSLYIPRSDHKERAFGIVAGE